jgi:hypothetical protein
MINTSSNMNSQYGHGIGWTISARERNLFPKMETYQPKFDLGPSYVQQNVIKSDRVQPTRVPRTPLKKSPAPKSNKKLENIVEYSSDSESSSSNI